MPVNTSEERVILSAADQFSVVFKQAQRSVDGMKQSLDFVKSSLAAVGVTVGAGALVQLHFDALKATAALDDMTESTGASVESLSAIQRVAKVGGQDFDGLTGQISKMIKGLKQGGEEGGKAAAAFAFLDIKTKDASGRFRDTGQIVIELAEKLSKYEDGGNKVALIQDALGKGAERYAPLLKDIADKTDLHATVTAKQAAEAEIAEKNINRLKLVMEDARRELVVGITPAIIEFTEKLLLASKASGGLTAGIATMMTAQTSNIGARLKELNEQIKVLEGFDWNHPLNRVSNAMTFGGLKTGMGMAESDLRNEREYLLMVQRQQALAGSGAGDYDARDLRLRQPKGLAYQSPDTKKPKVDPTAEKLSPYQRAELEMLQAIAKAKLGGDSEAYSTQLAIEAGKYGELNEAQKTRLIQLAAEKDLQREDAKLKEETGRIVEARGEKDLRANEERRAELDQLRESAMSAEQIENEAYARRLESLKKFSDAELEANGGAQAIAQQMEADHMQRVRDIRSRGLTNLAEFNKASWRQQTATVFGELASLTAGVAQHNRKLFELNKIAAIANAIISTAAGVTKALEVYPPPLSFVMAAAQGAAGAIQIATIASTQFGSSTAPSVGGTPAPAVTPVSATSNSKSAEVARQTTIIHLQPGGDKFSRQQVRDLLKQLDEEQRDGGRVVVVG